MGAAEFRFDEASHTYTLGGRRLPSVTQLLAPIKPDFSMVPPAVLEAKRALGTAVHLACELDDTGELDESGTDTRVLAYVLAWRKFKAETGFSVLLNEQRLFHPQFHFAGTLDRLGKAGSGMLAAHWLLDIKTGPAYSSIGVQLAAYEMLLRANPDMAPPNAVKRYSLHLNDDGTYKLVPWSDPADSATFMACLAIHAFKERTPQ